MGIYRRRILDFSLKLDTLYHDPIEYCLMTRKIITHPALHPYIPEESSLIVTMPELTKNFLLLPASSNTVNTPGLRTARDGTC